MILLAGLAYGRNRTGLKFLRALFKINELIPAIENEATNSIIRAGLLRILSVGYIDCPGHSVYASHRSYRFDALTHNFPPQPITERTDKELSDIWRIIGKILSDPVLKGSEILVYDTLHCAYSFLRFNLLWKLPDTPITQYIHLLFAVLVKNYELWRDYHAASNLRYFLPFFS